MVFVDVGERVKRVALEDFNPAGIASADNRAVPMVDGVTIHNADVLLERFRAFLPILDGSDVSGYFLELEFWVVVLSAGESKCHVPVAGAENTGIEQSAKLFDSASSERPCSANGSTVTVGFRDLSIVHVQPHEGIKVVVWPIAVREIGKVRIHLDGVMVLQHVNRFGCPIRPGECEVCINERDVFPILG